MKKIINWISYTGVWATVLSATLLYILNKNCGFMAEDEMFPFIAALTCTAVTVTIWSSNALLRKLERPADAPNTFSALRGNPDPYISRTGKRKATYPPVSSKMLHHLPTGFCLGKYKNLYVCRSPSDQGAILINGGSGSGKTSSAIVPYLLQQKSLHEMNSLIIDIKHELSDITTHKGDGSIIIDPLDRRSYGIDPFWKLGKNPTSKDVFDAAYLIAISLIPPQNGDAAYWSDSARFMFLGFIIHYYKNENQKNLADIIKKIFSAPIENSIEEVVTKSVPGSQEYMAMIDFHGMAPETLMSVYSNLKNHLFPLIADPDLAFCIGYNPRVYYPDLLRSHDVYLCIPEHKLSQYGQLVYLVLNTFFSWALELPEMSAETERERKPIGVIMDETVALLSGVGGKLELLPQALRVLRSKGIMTVICVQSISGLKCVYSEHEVNDILSNIPYKLFLDATTQETQKMVSDWCGNFRQKTVDWTRNAKGKGVNISYKDEPIVKPEDLVTLSQTGEAILITSIGGYNRIRKTPYYSESYFQMLFEKIKSDETQQEQTFTMPKLQGD